MLKKHTIIWGLILALVLLQGQSYALISYTWTEGNYIIPDISRPMGGGADLIDIYNNVTVAMMGEGVSTFNMHDSSQLTMSGGRIGELNLYDDALASIFKGGDDVDYIFVDSASTALVKLYATEIGFDGETLHFSWLNESGSYTIHFIGSYDERANTYSHVQFVPEPATLALLAVGFFAIRKRRKR